MKITSIVIILAIVAVAGLAIGSLLFSIGGSWDPSGATPHEIDETKTADIQGVNTIEVNTVSEDVNIIPSDGEFKVHMYGLVSSSDNRTLPKLVIKEDDGSLSVRVEKDNSWFIGFMQSDVTVDLYIPRDYKEDIAVDTTSGNIESKGLNVHGFKTDTTSGNTEINDLVGDLFFADSVSGHITLSGNVDEAVFDSTSGEIDADGFFGSVEADTISGNVNIDSQTITADWKIDTTSGDVELSVGDDYKVDFDSTSGKASTDVSMRIEKSSDNILIASVGDPEHTVTIRTVSGDLEIG